MKQKLYLLITTLLISFLISEIALTLMTEKDLDGNLSFNYVHLKPYHLPILETAKKIKEIENNKLPDSLLVNYENENFTREYFNVRLIPDSLLGWVPNPIFKSTDGLYIYNRDGIRSRDILTEYPPKTKLRIAIFGDSYSHGDEVAFENTIGNYLEEFLAKNNVDSEVLNFAVSGYGIDQAFLRWNLINEQFKPDIVILGIQFENAKRNINLVRPFYYYITEIPYSKPRFVIEGNKLQLLKNPIVDITKTVDIIEHFNNWEFSHFEGFYSEENYNPNIFYYSKTISIVSSTFSQLLDEVDFYKPQHESFQVTYKVFEMFKDSVERKGQIFIPVHLPVKSDFDFLTQKFLDFAYDKKFIYDELFDALTKKANFVESYRALESWNKANDNEGLFMKHHYSPKANKIIANQIFDFIQNEHPQIFIHSARKD